MTENEELAVEVEELNAALASWMRENDELRAERDGLAARVGKLEAERVVLASERDHYAAECGRLDARVAELEAHPLRWVDAAGNSGLVRVCSRCGCRGCDRCIEYRTEPGCACTNRGAS